MVLASIPGLVGDTGTGPALSSSSLHIRVQRSEPTDAMPEDIPEISPLEQASAQPQPHTPSTQEVARQPKPPSKAFNIQAAAEKSPLKHDSDTKPAPSLTAVAHPAASKRGADVDEIRPAQLASAGKYARLSRDYRSSILRLVERHKYYPLHARRKGLEGTSRVAFTIHRNGVIAGVSLTGSSGERLLDQAAIQTIKQIGKAPPFPKDIQRNQWRFAIPIAYSLR